MSRPITYEEFQQRVRRHKPSLLLPAIAETAIRYFDKETWAVDRLRVPWALAEVAKASIVSGNEFRSGAITERDITQICFAYSSLDDPLRKRKPGLSGSLEAFFMRLENSQFAYQLTPFEEIGRIGALFEDVDNRETEIITSEFLGEIIGCTLHDYVNAGIAISSVAQSHGGYFDPTWSVLWDGADSIHARFSMETVSRVFHDHYLTDFESFRKVALQYRQGEQSLRQHEYNPLMSRPFVEMPNGTFLAPQIHLAYRRLTLAAIYYAVVDKLNKENADKFTRDIGLIFQHYVGRQLSIVPGATVVPEIVYDNDQRSVDWIVITNDFVVLVEVKSTRLSHAGRMGDEQLRTEIDRSVGRATKQIERTDRLIADGHPSFKGIPSNLTRYGLFVTLEPYWTETNPYFDRLINPSSVTSTIASSRQIERLVATSIECGDAASVLDGLFKNRTSPPNVQEWLTDGLTLKNPILDRAWTSNPLWDEIFEGD
jgi:hypothetical protein